MKTRLTSDATICISMEIVDNLVATGQKDAALTALNDNWKILSENPSSESLVYSKYHFANASYHKAYGVSIDFFNAVLTYLAYTPLEQIPVELQESLAVDVSIATIASNEIFNFGEVVATPILKVIENHPVHGWLFELVNALNEGSLGEFNRIIHKYDTQFKASSVLVDAYETIRQKVILLSIMNLVFNKTANDRNISFENISTQCNIEYKQVEYYLMKALSLKLIKGEINEVESSINVTWVVPRILNTNHIQMLSAQLGVWVDKVKSTLVSVEDLACDM